MHPKDVYRLFGVRDLHLKATIPGQPGPLKPLRVDVGAAEPLGKIVWCRLR
jgi:hypothetical protein